MNVIKLSAPAIREFWEIPVLFEDEYLLALDKPSGLRVTPDRDDLERPCLIRLLHAGIAAQKPWATQRGLTYLSQAHRVDAETSGVLLLAKNKPTLLALANLFGTDQPEQRYFAFIAGTPSSDRFEMDAKIAPNVLRLEMMRIDPREGKRAHTIFEVAEKFSDHTTLHCRPVTARNHQVRIHLKHAGFPIIGDTLYGGKPLWLSRLKKSFRLKPGREERPLIARVALHLEQISLTHPMTNAPVVITAALPKDFRVALRYLREFGGTDLR